MGLAGLFGEVRWPRCVTESLRLVAGRELEQGIDPVAVVVENRKGIAALFQALRNGGNGEVLWLHVGHLVPLKGAGHPSLGFARTE